MKTIFVALLALLTVSAPDKAKDNGTEESSSSYDNFFKDKKYESARGMLEDSR